MTGFEFRTTSDRKNQSPFHTFQMQKFFDCSRNFSIVIFEATSHCGQFDFVCNSMAVSTCRNYRKELLLAQQKQVFLYTAWEKPHPCHHQSILIHVYDMCFAKMIN